RDCNDMSTTAVHTLSLHDALPISLQTLIFRFDTFLIALRTIVNQFTNDVRLPPTRNFSVNQLIELRPAIWRPNFGYNRLPPLWSDRRSTRLNSSHVKISYAVFCLK